jgi:hypothetical protein
LARNHLIPPTYKDDLLVWEKRIITTTDQDVTDNATRQNSAPSSGPALSLAVVSGEVWIVKFGIIYSGNNTTGDYKWAFTFPANCVVMGTHQHWSVTDTIASANAATAVGGGTLWPTPEIPAGTDAAHTTRLIRGEFTAHCKASGNIVYTFANNSAAAGRTSRTHAGSYMYCRRNSVI